MKTSLTLALIVTALLSVGIAAAQETKPDAFNVKTDAAGLDPKALEALSAAMQKQIDDQQVSGVIGLIANQGEVGYYETFGQRLVEKDKPMSKETLFRIYSMTKPIVAVTAMSVWEEGKFKLDDPISVHCPEWKEAIIRGEKGEFVPAKTPITPRHLMTHSSGIRYGKDGLNLEESTTLEEFSQSLAKRPLKFQPGTDYTYGYSIDLLGRYIEAIEGKPLDAVMRERVFDKLGMDDTAFWVRNAEDRDRVAMVYTKGKEGKLKPAMAIEAVMKKPARMMGGQGLMSSTEDYARFCEMLANKGERNGKRILKTETVELMFQNHLKEIGKVYGLGGRVDGKGGYSWGGAAGTRFWVDSANKGYGVFMIQTWGYKAPTFDVFQKHVKAATQAEK